MIEPIGSLEYEVVERSGPQDRLLLLVHGYGGNFYEGYFPRFAQAAAEQGYASLALTD